MRPKPVIRLESLPARTQQFIILSTGDNSRTPCDPPVATKAGARNMLAIEEPVAAAAGAKILLTEPVAR